MKMRLFIIPLIGLFILIGWFVWNYALPHITEQQTLKNIDAKLATVTHQEYYDVFVKHIDSIFNSAGIEGQVERVTSALAEGRIGMYQCHTLAHDIGHYAGYRDNFKRITDSISSTNLNFCGSGFIHGVEGELANWPHPEYIDALHTFCTLIAHRDRYYTGCYHGAGHGFMERAASIEEALKQCDTLIYEGDTSRSHCYRGVFSEHNASRHDWTPAKLLEFCAAVDSHLQFDCAAEMNGFNATIATPLNELNDNLSVCFETLGISVGVQKECLRSVTWAATDIELGRNDILEPLPYVYSLSESMQKLYIENVWGVFIKTTAYNKAFVWDDFCKGFSGGLYDYCRDVEVSV